MSIIPNQITKDSGGNKIAIRSDIITLHLKGKKSRRIGAFKQRGETKVYFKIEKIKDVFRINNSWSVCYEITKFLEDDDLIEIYCLDNNTTYYLTKEEFEEKKDFLHFKTQGYELKCYVPLDEWHQKETKVR